MSAGARDVIGSSLRGRLVTLLFVVHCIAVCALVARAYPPLWGGARRAARMKTTKARARSAAPILVDTSAVPLGSATFDYRGGPSRSGVVPDALVDLSPSPVWSASGLNVGIHSANKASPAVDETGVYVGTDASWFYAFDLDGRQRWRFYAANALHGIHGTASLDASRVYFGAYNGVMYALRKSDGSPDWVTPLGDSIGASPVIVGDDLYIAVETSSPPDGFVARLDRSTGRVFWRSDLLHAQAHSSPVVDPSRRLAFVGANSACVYGIDMGSGRVRWRTRVDGDVKGTGLLAEDRLVMLSLPGTLYAFDPATGDILWSTTLPGDGSRVRGSPAWDPVADVLIAASARHVSGVNRRTGAIVWTRELDVERINTSPVIVQAGFGGNWVAWMQCADRSLCAFEPATGSSEAEIDLPGALTSVPAVYRGSLFFSFEEEAGLWRFD